MFKTTFSMAEAVQLRDKIIRSLYPELESDARIDPQNKLGEDGLLSLTSDIVDFLIEEGIIVGGEVPDPKPAARTPSGKARMDDPA